ncbi:MAG: hypothetical protein JWM81_711 [Candidatus Saccharibacteria bacterium]|nr:hypothetical protein [Candidatus Saccharibacteria bacterium]
MNDTTSQQNAEYLRLEYKSVRLNRATFLSPSRVIATIFGLIAATPVLFLFGYVVAVCLLFLGVLAHLIEPSASNQFLQQFYTFGLRARIIWLIAVIIFALPVGVIIAGVLLLLTAMAFLYVRNGLAELFTGKQQVVRENDQTSLMQHADSKGWQLPTATQAVVPQEYAFGYRSKCRPLFVRASNGVPAIYYRSDDGTVDIIRVPINEARPVTIINSHLDTVGDSMLPEAIPGTQQIKLEGDFGKYFTVLAQSDQAIDALVMLNPNAMWHLLTEIPAADIETGANALNFVFRASNDPDLVDYRLQAAVKAATYLSPVASSTDSGLLKKVHRGSFSRQLSRKLTSSGKLFGLFTGIFFGSLLLFMAVNVLPRLPGLIIGIPVGIAIVASAVCIFLWIAFEVYGYLLLSLVKMNPVAMARRAKLYQLKRGYKQRYVATQE